MRADWFVFATFANPMNSYLTFLGINSSDPAIDALNNVNRFSAMESGYPAIIRAGFTVSRTEGFNRLLEWYPTTKLGTGAVGSGHLIKSYNEAADTGTYNIFARPYRPTTNFPAGQTPGPYDFDFGDSDNIFTLPNGLNGFYTTEPAAGVVASVASIGEGFPGPTRCFQCHDNKTNIVPFLDQLHATISAVPAGTFSPASLTTLLLGEYNQANFDVKTTAMGSTFGTAYASLNLPALDIAGLPSGLATEVMNVITNNYSIILQDTTAAGEMGVTVSQLVSAIKSSPTLASSLSDLVVNHVARRDLWEASYAQLRKILFPQL